jgi:hypothetical protein
VRGVEGVLSIIFAIGWLSVEVCGETSTTAPNMPLSFTRPSQRRSGSASVPSFATASALTPGTHSSTTYSTPAPSRKKTEASRVSAVRDALWPVSVHDVPL